jgi:tRNA pseudouridine55 synthase
LIAGVGKGTKVLQQFLECTKTYEAIVLFGAQTDTYDRVGKILKRGPYEHITEEKVETALAKYRGKITQLPPLYSALKMNGKPLYEYAREGKPIPREIPTREVEVKELEMLEFMPGGTHPHKFPEEEAGEAEKKVAEQLWDVEREQEIKKGENAELASAGTKRKVEDEQDDIVKDAPDAKRVQVKKEEVMSGGLEPAGEKKDMGPPAARVRMTVTSGFYVRSLCHDLGQALGSQAIMAELIRTRQGQFELGKNVLDYDDLSKGEDVWSPQVERMLDEWSSDYKPFAGSNAETNTATPAKAEEPAVVAKNKPAEVEAVAEVAAAPDQPAVLKDDEGESKPVV